MTVENRVKVDVLWGRGDVPGGGPKTMRGNAGTELAVGGVVEKVKGNL